MDSIPIQNLIIDNDTNIGLTSGLVDGTYKTLSLTDLSNNVYSKISDLSSNLNTKINTKENILTFNGPLSKVLNSVSIDLSNYLSSSTASSTYATISNLNTKQNIISVSTPLIKNVSNNISIDLSAYPLKTNVDSSLNSLTTNKQNIFTCITPLIKNDVSNNISIDLSAYPLKTYVDGSLNTLSTNKQNNLTFSNPFLNTSNTITLKYNSNQFNIDSSGNLNLISVSGITNLDYNNITLNKPTNFQSDWNTTIINKPSLSFVPLAGGTITGNLTVNGDLYLKNGTWHKSIDGVYRTYYGANEISYYCCGANNTDAHIFMNSSYTHVFKILNSGNITCSGSANIANSINITGATNAAQSLYFRSTDYNLGIAGANGNYSSTALQNDMILRTLANTNLILQSGSGGYGLKIDTANNISCSGTLSATSFSGSGSGITNLNYSIITLNKPTNFQSDWATTIINKPDLTVYAIKTNVDSSLNTLVTNKQDN